MRVRNVFWLFACGLLLLANPVPGRAGGSEQVFTALWSPEVLTSVAAEKKSGKRGEPDRSGPAAVTTPAMQALMEAGSGPILRP